MLNQLFDKASRAKRAFHSYCQVLKLCEYITARTADYSSEFGFGHVMRN